jgi:hypothetical protein
MKPELLFLILFLFGFVLYCFLGNNPGFYKKIEGMNTINSSSSDSNASYDSSVLNASNNSYENYNHYNGTSIATKYYGPNGEVVVINSPSSITVINASGTSAEYKSSSGSTNIEAIKFMGPNGESATFVSGKNGGKAVKITDMNGNSVLYGEKPVSSGASSSINPLTTYYGSTGNPVPNNSAYAYVSPSSSPSSEYGQMYTQTAEQSSQPYDYSSSLPPGIPKSQILPGQQDLYILKSQVVPPVCPACNPVVIYKDKECQACPACARCPEPSFECKKVPNYNAINNEYLPTPVLNSFSSFGM